MKKIVFCCIVLCVCCFVLTSCRCKHEWAEASCTVPKTCTLCKKSEGESLGHNWKNANCTAPETCIRCGETRGIEKGHDWEPATCTVPRTCIVCGVSEGTPIEHDWKEATCTEPKICKVCGKEEGENLPHNAGEWIVITEATEDCVGEKQQICSICGNVVETSPVFFYDISEEEILLYTNVLDTLNSAKAAHANPDSFRLLGAVAKKDNGRTTIYISYTGLDGQKYTEYLWKDVSGDIVKAIFGHDNYTGKFSSVDKLNLDEILYFEKTGVYVPTLVTVSMDKSLSQYF